jgi:hypothetical protein
MVVTMARKKGIGIIVTGSHQEETGIFTACEQDLRKPNRLIRSPIHGLQRGSAHLSRSSSKNEGGSPTGQTPTYPATNRRKRAWRIGACRQNRSPEAVPTPFARVGYRNCWPHKADAHMGRAEKREMTDNHDGTPIFGAQFA